MFSIFFKLSVWWLRQCGCFQNNFVVDGCSLYQEVAGGLILTKNLGELLLPGLIYSIGVTYLGVKPLQTIIMRYFQEKLLVNMTAEWIRKYGGPLEHQTHDMDSDLTYT